MGRNASSETDNVLNPLTNRGLLQIEKEMIRMKKDKSREPTSQKKINHYKAWLMLETYFLKKGFTDKAMKMAHQAILMRETTKDLKKKAFLDCESWRILDHDLKNYEKKELVNKLKSNNKFTNHDHLLFRKLVSKKVSKCIVHIRSNWIWNGPMYEDEKMDIKARNAVETVRSYLILQNQKERDN